MESAHIDHFGYPTALLNPGWQAGSWSAEHAVLLAIVWPVVLTAIFLLANQSQAFGSRSLRAALDSRPLWGAGRVEDTYNLLGHALKKVTCVVADQQGRELAEVGQEAGAECPLPGRHREPGAMYEGKTQTAILENRKEYRCSHVPWVVQRGF